MALYRKYRPASFAEVVGQEQVTQPLSVALDSGRINHAYLFSGPRGCGKTSSARIMARSLNCVEGPTSTPCGKCNSCISLAPNGPGNLDVTELDAASNRSVDDMRELRDRAMYAPAESRYRIFIIDEAHMITRDGANALLKIVEEPPAHLIFIFATTEPEKILPTIRSRTHHYPFRLLTPQSMRGLLERTVASEHVAVEDSVYPLVIRAGGGSPRDTLSILDQLIAGAGPDGLDYNLARMLLGATDDTLIDTTIDALAGNDNAALFQVVDDAIEAGLDPRRFATDLLDRFRDLMVLQSVPDALTLGLVDAPTDRGDILRDQATHLPAGEAARLAALVNDGLRGLKGATSPRLLLEILCAKMLLPSAQPAATATAPAAAAPAPAPTEIPAKYERRSVRLAREAAARKTAEVVAPAPAPAPKPEPKPKPEPRDGFATIQEKWATISDVIFKTNSVAGILLSQATLLGLRDDSTLVIGHNTGALAHRINDPQHAGSIVTAIKQETDLDVTIECVVGTDPKAAGFSEPKNKKVWNPEPKPKPKPEPKPEPEPAPASDNVWGAPAPLGGGQPATPPPPPVERFSPAKATAPQPPAAPQPVQEAPKPRWQQAAERGMRKMEERAKRPSFSDGVPLPPEPEEPDVPPDLYGYPADEGIPEPQTPQATSNYVVDHDEEEEMVREAAQGVGNRDHRDAMTVAVDILSEELGARQL
ncbi:DNA polymerase III subunit gamma/tau [Corynebacterium diphtheriae]|uniref:DNA polymerase III subunit gamma and tau n=1 Tax=Corynebacterium diphtheriae TaxID=1717 RepID=UPI00086AD6EC|nr:DNA polymerase III subunit gamma and tau [Corynebacterium diphtheriae]MBG9336707.1 DNA polymerase III subunit gamma and tau [Corynebacterium diphtheriae bv. gravis]ODS19360.1 DNA polymerase III subunit gamma/tau [Corynebacterium diphtheriae]ONF64886.1 DNA polymerase III subunit gamma/tau [Corynebacterium diphtheriae]CAB0924911.1 DNA polymerase III subunit gamma and tau [Corynebacterium diphtheriae]